VQEEIAGEVVAALKVRLLPEQAMANAHRSGNVEAYTKYLLGNDLFARSTYGDWQRAIPAYREAIALDPLYAAAYAALAQSERLVADSTGDAAGMDQASAHADKAIALAPDLADGYLARGVLRFTFKRDWAGAQSDCEKALALSPGESRVHRVYGALMSALGRAPEAIAATRRSVDLDPLSAGSWTQMGRLLNATGDYPAARQALDRALSITPDSERAHLHRGINSQLAGRAEEALSDYRKTGKYETAGVAMAEHTLGHARESQAALDKAIAGFAQGAAYQIAEVYAWRGERDKAFEWLERALVQNDGGLTSFRMDPLLASLRGDARYQALLEKMGQPR
jgi:serine/threonine-protein kinase